MAEIQSHVETSVSEGGADMADDIYDEDLCVIQRAQKYVWLQSDACLPRVWLNAIFVYMPDSQPQTYIQKEKSRYVVIIKMSRQKIPFIVSTHKRNPMPNAHSTIAFSDRGPLPWP